MFPECKEILMQLNIKGVLDKLLVKNLNEV
jgi:hypothetical protein